MGVGDAGDPMYTLDEKRRMNADRGLPGNLDAERFVLGSFLLQGTAAVERAAAPLTADCFSLEKHRRIWARIRDLYRRGASLAGIGRELSCSRQGAAGLMALARRHFAFECEDAEAALRKRRTEAKYLLARPRILACRRTVLGWLREAGYIRCRECGLALCEKEFGAGMRAGSNPTVRCRECCRLLGREWRESHVRNRCPLPADDSVGPGRIPAHQ